jgi:hypothetical protein
VASLAPGVDVRRLVSPFPGIFVRRSIAYWVLVHLVVVAVQLLGSVGRPVDPAGLFAGGNPLLVLVVVGMGLLEARRRNEDLFLANLGYGWPTVATYLAVPAAVLEASLAAWR